MVDHPKECCICGGVFERTKTTVKTWMVTIIEKRTRLTCPECWDTVQEALEVHIMILEEALTYDDDVC